MKVEDWRLETEANPVCLTVAFLLVAIDQGKN